MDILRTIDAGRVEQALNNGYMLESRTDACAEEFYRVHEAFASLLEKAGAKIGIFEPMEIGETYDNYQGDNLIRAELTSWKLVASGLVEGLAKFLKESAPEFAIILTFDFWDVKERLLESPVVLVTPTEIVADFDLCELSDTPSAFGFR